MQPVIQSLMTGLPVLLSHFLTTLLILTAGSVICLAITPNKEFKLIQKGNVSAAISVAGTLLGLAIPMAYCLASSVNVYDLLVWGGVVLVIQLLTYYIIDWLLHGIAKDIQADKIAPVIFLVAVKLTVALINAAAIAG